MCVGSETSFCCFSIRVLGAGIIACRGEPSADLKLRVIMSGTNVVPVVCTLLALSSWIGRTVSGQAGTCICVPRTLTW